MYASNQPLDAPIGIAQRAARLWEIDTARGVAVVLMVVYHFIWDLANFRIIDTNMLATPWQSFARSIGSTFIFVMGLSATLVYARLVDRARRAGEGSVFRWYLLRGLRIFGWGLAITLATFFATPSNYIVFGILHLLGASLILLYPFLRLPRWLLVVIALPLIALGLYLNKQSVGFPWLLPFGVLEQGRSMSDWYPLLPWFGVALLGVVAGRTWYANGDRQFALADRSTNPLVRGLSFVGRHSLVIYLLHQPILIGTLIALGYGSL